MTHLAALAATALAALFLVRAGRKPVPSPSKWERVFGIFLLLLYPIEMVFLISMNRLTHENCLPLHFCSVAGFLAGLGLLTKRQRIIEVAYYWGLAGTLQALLTPTLTYDFPDPAYFVYFALHSGVVVAALYLVFGLRRYPAKGAVLRAWIWSNVYLAAAALGNWLVGSNYGYTAHKPEDASLMDVLGPWPWYLVSMEALAVVLFALLSLPFFWLRHDPPEPQLAIES